MRLGVRRELRGRLVGWIRLEQLATEVSPWGRVV
jgi:hypothetical protein